MSDEEKKDRSEEILEDRTLIDTEFTGEAVDDGYGDEPTVSVDDDVSADDGDSSGTTDMPDDEDEPVDDATVMVEQEPEPETDEDATVLVDIESDTDDDEDDSEKTMLMDSPFPDEDHEDEKPGARLNVNFGNDSGKEFPVSTDVSVVGRSLDCDIVLNDPSVSRKHFEIHFRDGGWILKDLGSVNGTNVNGERVDGEIPLDEDSKIEVGQTMMSLLIDQDKTQALELPESPGPDDATIVAESPIVDQVNFKSAPKIEVSEASGDDHGKVFPIAVVSISVLIVALIGIAIAQFGFGVRILPIGPDPETIEAAKKAEAEKIAKSKAEAVDLNRRGVESFQARDWDKAIALFEQAQGIDPSIDGIDKRLVRSLDEKRNSSYLVAGKKTMEKEDFDEALGILGRVGDSSALYPEARQLIEEINDRPILEGIESIRTLLEERNKSEAKSSYITLLEAHPDDDRVVALYDELVDAGVKLEPPKRRKVIATEPVPDNKWRPTAQKRGHGPRQVFKEALHLYDSGAFHQAVSILRTGAVHSSGVTAEKARSLADRIEQFATAFGSGKSALTSKRLDKAEQGLSMALRLDHGIDGHYESEIRGYLGDTYRGRAASAVQNTDYVLASRSVRKALSYKPNDHLARNIMEKCFSVAELYYREASELIKDGHKDKARGRLKTVLDILPSSHQLADKAIELMRKTN